MRELSEKGQRFLNSLERFPALPVATVEKSLIDNGYPVFDVWLDFHDRYAGYTDAVGRDGVTWGLMHEHSRFGLGKKGRFIDAEAYFDESDDLWYAYAANAHPSYDYTIDERGHFYSMNISSFELFLNREGVWKEFLEQSKKPRIERSRSNIIQAIKESPDVELIDELSDEYIEWWQGENIIATCFIFADKEEHWLQALLR